MGQCVYRARWLTYLTCQLNLIRPIQLNDFYRWRYDHTLVNKLWSIDNLWLIGNLSIWETSDTTSYLSGKWVIYQVDYCTITLQWNKHKLKPLTITEGKNHLRLLRKSSLNIQILVELSLLHTRNTKKLYVFPPKAGEYLSLIHQDKCLTKSVIKSILRIVNV